MKNKTSLLLFFIFCFLFLGYQYYNNIGKILCAKADNYYRKNNIEKAQEFYEKAFEKGFISTKARNNYVNSIISLPVTLSSQEKLVKFIENTTDDLARLDARCFLEDIKREINQKYYGSYIANAVFNQQIVRWGKNPITVSFVNSDNVPEYFVAEIKKALQEWEDATEKEIQFVEDNNIPNIIISFEEKNPAEDTDKKYIVAYTIPQIEFNHLEKMEIKFYIKDLDGNYFTQNQVYNTALHEIAHALGFMGHCNDRESILYLTKDAKSLINDIREELTEADIKTIKLLYKIKPEITNVKNTKSEYIPILVLGSAEDINNEKYEEALNYVKDAPELPSGYIDLAESYLIKKDYNSAIKSLKKALKLSETEDVKAMVYYNLAVVYFYNNDLDKSKSYLLNSIMINYSDEKQYLLAELLVREGNFKEAINEYTKLIQRNPNNIEYVIGLTNLYIQQRHFFKARQTLKAFFKKNPQAKNNPRFSSYKILKFGL